MCLGVPAKLEYINPFTDELFRTGKISFGGISKQISLAMLPEAKPGDYILIHAGVALSIINEEDAKSVFDHLKNSGEWEEEDFN